MVGEVGESYWFAKPAPEKASEFESHIIRQFCESAAPKNGAVFLVVPEYNTGQILRRAASNGA
jgi:hypothetical protein